jgi:putative peptidoglycan lipid II flippase
MMQVDPAKPLPADEVALTGRGRPSLTRASALMSVGTLLSRVTGLLRLAVIAYSIGIAETRLTDSYNLANTVPNIIYEVVLGGVLVSVFVPVFVELLEKEGNEKAWEVMSGIINFSLVVLAGIAVLGIVAAPWMAHFYASRLQGTDAHLQYETIVFLLRLFIPQVIFYALYFILAGVLNAHGRFAPPGFTPALNNLVVIAVFIAFHQAYGSVTLGKVTETQLLVLGLGTTAGVAAAGVALLPFLRGLGTYHFSISVRHPSVRKLGRLSVFSLALIATNQIGFLIVQWLANGEKGAFSAYLVAFTFFLLPQGVFGYSINTALLPGMSEAAANERWKEFHDRVSTGVRSLLLLMLPTAIAFIVLAHPIVRVLLEHGVMKSHSTALVAGVLRILAVALVPFALFQFFLRGFYALQDTKTPFLVNALSVAVAIAINLVVFHVWHVRGLAAGNAFSYALAGCVLGAALHRRGGGMNLGRMARSAGRIGIAAIGMGLVVWLMTAVTHGLIDSASIVPQALGLAGCVAAGAVSYLGLCRAVHVEELSFVKGLIRRRAG